MKKCFTLEMREIDGKMDVNGKNDGFNFLELYGFLEWKKNDIMKQISGEITPDTVKREVVKRDKEAEPSESDLDEGIHEYHLLMTEEEHEKVMDILGRKE